MGTSEENLNQLIARTNCPRGFECCRPGLEKLSKVEPLGRTGLIDCLEEDGKGCPLGVSFGFGRFCTCLVRAHILRHLGR